MAKKKFQIAADDKFARAITVTQKDGTVITFVFQPYVTGMYCVVESEGMRDQLGVPHKDVGKMAKHIVAQAQKNGENADVRYREYGQFLSEEDIKFINE